MLIVTGSTAALIRFCSLLLAHPLTLPPRTHPLTPNCLTLDCPVCHQPGKLHYYKGKGDLAPKGTIDLSGDCNVLVIDEGSELYDKSRPHCLKVSSQLYPAIMLNAESESLQREWVVAIGEMIIGGNKTLTNKARRSQRKSLRTSLLGSERAKFDEYEQETN